MTTPADGHTAPAAGDQSGYVVAVDTVGAGFHEKVIVVGGSSARMAEGNKDCPVDSAIIGVIDTIDYEGMKAEG